MIIMLSCRVTNDAVYYIVIYRLRRNKYLLLQAITKKVYVGKKYTRYKICKLAISHLLKVNTVSN